MPEPTAFEKLNVEAERQGLRVHLTAEGTGRRARLGEVRIVGSDGEEVTGMRITPRRDLQRTAAALLSFLEARRAEA